MPQTKQLTWVELRVGVFVLVALALLAIGVLYITGAGQLGPKYYLYTYMPTVEGLQSGAPVRLNGVDIGYVQDFGIAPHPVDEMHSVQLKLRINRKYQDDVRTDSQAKLGVEGLLGNSFISVSRGLTGQPLHDGATLASGEEISVKEVFQRSVALMDQFQGVMDNIKSNKGTIGKLINDPELYDRLNQTAAEAHGLVADVRKGRGTLGQLVANDELYRKVDDTMDNARSVLASVNQGKGSLGKLVNDPTVYQNAQQLLQHGNALVSGIQNGQGTIGKLATDDTLYNNLRDSSANVREATAKLNSQTGTMGKLFTDPQLYDNLTGLTADMRTLMKDFHENPKKYLHVKFSIF